MRGGHGTNCRATKGADGAADQGARPAAHQSTSSETRASAHQRTLLSMARGLRAASKQQDHDHRKCPHNHGNAQQVGIVSRLNPVATIGKDFSPKQSD